MQIEDSLYRFPGVWDAGAIGIPDPGIKLGELPVAAIVVPPHSRIPTSDEVRAHCAKELGAFAVPVYVDVRTGDGKKAGENEHRGEGLPRNVNGKLNKDRGYSVGIGGLKVLIDLITELRKEILERMEKEGVIEALKSGGGKLAKL